MQKASLPGTVAAPALSLILMAEPKDRNVQFAVLVGCFPG